MALQRMREAAEKAKIELSSSNDTEINLMYLQEQNHLVTTLSRSKFDQLIDGIVTATMKPVSNALKSAGLSKDDIDEIIMVGGSTRIPAIQKAVTDFFGKELNKSVNPDECVSLGACIQGGVLTGDVTDVLLLDVTPLNLGIETMGGVFTTMIEANTTIPTTKSQVFSTASDNQPEVSVVVGQGNRSMMSDNKVLGTFNLSVPPAPRGIPQIEISLNIDANGVLEVTAVDKGTGKQNNIRIDGGSQLSDDEIERMKADAEANAEADKLAKEKVDKLNQADSLIFQTDKQLKEFSDKLSDENKTNIETALESLKESFKSEDIEKIDTDIETLNSAWTTASSEMYANAESNSDPMSGTEASDDNVDDVDFEEVK